MFGIGKQIDHRVLTEKVNAKLEIPRNLDITQQMPVTHTPLTLF